METIYSAPGDFNGDNQEDRIYLLRSSDGKYYLKLKYSNKSYEALLNLNIKNPSAWVEDVDGNKKDDLILSSIDDDTTSLYVFTYDENVKLLISPRIIGNNIKLDNMKPYICISKLKEKNFSIINKATNATLFSTDIDIIPGESLFTCDYILSDDHSSLGCVSVSFTLDSNGKLNILDVHEFERDATDQ